MAPQRSRRAATTIQLQRQCECCRQTLPSMSVAHCVKVVAAAVGMGPSIAFSEPVPTGTVRSSSRGCNRAEPQEVSRRHRRGVVRPKRWTVRAPVSKAISKRLYRHIFQQVCPWNVRFSHELAEDSPFREREFVAGKDAVTLATDILALDQDAFSAAFRKSPMKRVKLRGLQRNAAIVLANG